MNSSPETREESAAPARRTPPATPRWVKVFGIIALVVALLVIIVLATGFGGEHGPGRHNPSGALERAPILEKAQVAPYLPS